jgi:hypothetical protein
MAIVTTVLSGVVYVVAIGGVTLIILKILDVFKMQVKTAQQVGLAPKRASKTQLQDYMESLPMALDQAIKLYDEQVAVCNANQYPPEIAEKVLKPLRERIELLQNIKKYEVIAKPAAQIGDKLLNKMGKLVDDIQ